eukprot:5210151-Prymnesium_polylepis.1
MLGAAQCSATGLVPNWYRPLCSRVRVNGGGADRGSGGVVIASPQNMSGVRRTQELVSSSSGCAGCSSTGHEESAAQFGKEAARSAWRVALDVLFTYDLDMGVKVESLDTTSLPTGESSEPQAQPSEAASDADTRELLQLRRRRHALLQQRQRQRTEAYAYLLRLADQLILKYLGREALATGCHVRSVEGDEQWWQIPAMLAPLSSALLP